MPAKAEKPKVLQSGTDISEQSAMELLQSQEMYQKGNKHRFINYYCAVFKIIAFT
jgi:hypothetical protein